MKKGGRIYIARGFQPKIISHDKVVSLAEEKKVPDADRDYGTMKSKHSITPYPQPDQPLDLVALAARLEAEKSTIRVSISAHTRKSARGDNKFNERRKLFDKGEFTICKGRKLGDDFHPLNFDEHDLRLKALYAKIIERKSMDTQNFDELAKYCRENNLEILSGVAQN